MKVDVADQIGAFCITQEDGQRLFELIHPALLEDRKVVLDFDKVKAIASPFLNLAFGQLVQDVSNDRITSNIEPVGLTRNNVDLIRRVIDNARDYHSDAAIREAFNQAISTAAKDC